MTGVGPAESVAVIPVQLDPTIRNERLRKPSSWDISLGAGGLAEGLAEGQQSAAWRWLLPSVKARYPLVNY